MSNISRFQNKVPIVYLAGGMKTGWQKKVKAEVYHSAIFIDPMDGISQGNESELQYTQFDLKGVISADIIFAYMEKTNPSGAGLATEVGLALGLGKHIIYVEDAGCPLSRYFGMVRTIADEVYMEDSFYYTALQKGIAALNEKIQQYNSAP